MELPLGFFEDQREKKPITLPKRQIEDALHVHPFQRTLGIVGPRLPFPAVDAKDEAKPVVAVYAEPGPTDGAAQRQLLAFQRGFLPNFPSAKPGTFWFFSPLSPMGMRATASQISLTKAA